MSLMTRRHLHENGSKNEGEDDVFPLSLYLILSCCSAESRDFKCDLFHILTLPIEAFDIDEKVPQPSDFNIVDTLSLILQLLRILE